jgi:hypothetical protein
MSLIENAFAGIVIAAETFNPSVFSESWLVRNGVISEHDFSGMRLFSPEVVQFQTSDLQVLIIPPKMQITFNISNDSVDFELPKQIATRTVELLPQTPFKALGLNFDYFAIHPANQDFHIFNRNLLGDGTYNLLEEFATPDSNYGRYFSKDHGAARLKLDIKPVNAGPEKKQMLQFSFNFHFDVSQLSSLDRAKKLGQFIGEWPTLKAYAEQLVKSGTVF